MEEGPQAFSTSLWPADPILDISQPSPPSSPDCLGFGPETHFPDRLILETEGEGDDEHVVNVLRRRKTGRPSEGWEKEKVIRNHNILETTRRSDVDYSSLPGQSGVLFSNPTTSSKAVPQKVPGTSSRTKPYLLDKLDSTFR